MISHQPNATNQDIVCPQCGWALKLMSTGAIQAHGKYNPLVSGHVDYCKASDKSYAELSKQVVKHD